MPAPAHVASLARAVLLAAATMALELPGGVASAAPQSVPGDAASERTVCAAPASPVALGSAQWNGWGRGVENTRYQPEPAIRASDVPKLALKWAFGYPGDSVSGQPTIVDGRVFVASPTGRVYSLDAKTGCIYWSFDAQAGVHTAISIAELAAAKKAPRPPKTKHRMTNAHLEVAKVPSAAFFGDDKGAVYAVEAEKGTLLWKTQVEAHPLARIQASPTLYQDRLYVGVGSSEPQAARELSYPCCTFRGSIAALDMAGGRIVWKTYLVSDEPRAYRDTAGAQKLGPAGVPILAAPTIDAARGLIYAASGGAYDHAEQPMADSVVALDLADGKVRWVKQLPAAEGAAAELDASPILRTLASGKQSILAGQRSGTLYSLDPDRSGDILWQLNASDGKAAGVAWGAAADHHSLYAPIPAGLIAIDIKTGVKRWQAESPMPACAWGGEDKCSHAQAQAITVIPGAAFSGSMDGHLRAYSTIDGKVLWDYDTGKDFDTVNHIKAAGGSLEEGGATIVNGVVYVNSGGAEHGRPGNVLLAFSVDGK